MTQLVPSYPGLRRGTEKEQDDLISFNEYTIISVIKQE